MIELGYDNCLGQGSPADAKIIGVKIAGEQDIHTLQSVTPPSPPALFWGEKTTSYL